jgi:hypothetical protein
MPFDTDFKKIPNPYNPYDIKTGRTYYNKAVVKEIKEYFESTPPQKIVFVQGSEGSGKSSTFDRLKNDPVILGQQYVPIYIHSNKVMAGKGDSLIAGLYDQLKKSIDAAGIQLFEEPLNSLKPDGSIEDLRNLFLAFERKTKLKKSIILLIFDDFDNIFELEDVETHVQVFRFFGKLIDEVDFVRFILSGRIDLKDVNRNSEISSCLKDIVLIKMKNLSPREFIETVTRPVDGWVTYTMGALAEIRRITGGNLYCQHLLCSYIILHLNTEQKYNCEVEDVVRAAELTIEDEREDFAYFWENLSVADKLVCAAIMDENVVKKRGLYYFIEQTSLLTKVFEPEALNEALDRLFTYDFIIKIEGRRFDEFPFKIPLYGRWIKKQHPFIDAVVEHFDDIAKDLDFPALGKIVQDIPKELFPPDRQDTVEFIQEWFKLKARLKEHERVGRDVIEVPLKIICRIFELSIEADSHPGMDYFTIDFGKINIGSIQEAFFLIQDRLEPGKDDIQHLRDLILTHVNSTKPCVFFCLKRNDKIDELVQKTFLNIILIENDDLKDILFSSRPLQTLKEILLQQISSSQISPYQTDGPAITTFYGRQRELKKVLGTNNRSFSIVGARKIGKSSLLARIKTEYEEIGVYSILMDLESPANPDHTSFLQRMELELNRLFNTAIHFGDSIEEFTCAMKNLPRGGRRLVIILDEIDGLLLYDKRQDFRLFRTFRSLFQEGCCQFILSGFEVLQNVKRGIDSPFYNFCEEIPLGPLEKKYALDLITEPMANIGISYENPADRELILQYTALHPNLVQFFCKHLIEKMDENDESNRKRLIRRTDIEDLYNYEFDNYVLDEFYMFYTDLSDLERLMVVLLLESGWVAEDISIKEVNRGLTGYGIILDERRIYKTLQKLVLRFILSDVGKGKYRFALPYFPEMLKFRIEEDLIENLVRRLKEIGNG